MRRCLVYSKAPTMKAMKPAVASCSRWPASFKLPAGLEVAATGPVVVALAAAAAVGDGLKVGALE